MNEPRSKGERRKGKERRAREQAVPVERRTGLERRLEAKAASDQIHAAIGLLDFAVDNGVMLDVDRWVLETAITRLKIALGKLEQGLKGGE